MDGKSRDMVIAFAALIAVSAAVVILVRSDASRRAIENLRLMIASVGRSEQPAPIQQNTKGNIRAPTFHLPKSSDRVAPPRPDGRVALNPASWITGDDYPAEALWRGWQGKVSIGWTVDETGRAINCFVMESSGHDALDKESCRLIVERARYLPAQDDQGRPISSADHRRIVWQLPE